MHPEYFKLCFRLIGRTLIITVRNKVGARLYFHRRLLFCPQGGWGLLPGTVPSPGVPGLGGCLVLGGYLVETHPDGYCCRRYASYWNAFLFGEFFYKKSLLIRWITKFLGSLPICKNKPNYLFLFLFQAHFRLSL